MSYHKEITDILDNVKEETRMIQNRAEEKICAVLDREFIGKRVNLRHGRAWLDDNGKYTITKIIHKAIYDMDNFSKITRLDVIIENDKQTWKRQCILY